jgi:hypothetical protein
MLTTLIPVVIAIEIRIGTVPVETTYNDAITSWVPSSHGASFEKMVTHPNTRGTS